MAANAGVFNLFNHPTTELLDPFELQRRKLSIQNALAAQQIQQQQIQQGSLALDAAQRDQAAEAAFRAQFMDPASPGGAPPAALPGGPGPGSAAWDPSAASVLPATVAPGGALPAASPSGPSSPSGGAPPGAMVRTPAGPAPIDIPDSALFRTYGSKAFGLIKTRNELQAAAATRQETLGKVREQDQKYWGTLAGGWEHSGYDPRLLPGMLQLAAGHGLQGTAEFQQFAQLAQAGDIDGLKRAASLVITPEIRKTIAETGAADALTTGRDTENAQKKLQNAGAILGSTRDNKPMYTAAYNALDAETQKYFTPPERWTPATAAEALNRGSSAAEQVTAAGNAATRAEQARHNKSEESQGWARIQDERSNRETITLTPEARDQMATMFATTGQLPNLGMGAAVAKERSGIINRAAEMYPNVTFASNAAMYSANKKSLADIQGRLDKVSAFESASKKNLDMFVAAADKIPDTGVPWLNTPLRKLSTSGLGSDDMAVANAARQTALREIARVTNDPNLSGQLSDSARHEVMGLSPEDATINQIKKVAKILVKDMENVHSSLTEQRDAITNRIGEGAPAVKPPAAAAPAAPAAPIPGAPGRNRGNF